MRTARETMVPQQKNSGRTLNRLVRQPILRLVFGVITAALGLVVIFWPGHPVVVVSILFGAQLIVSAIYRFVSVLGTPPPKQEWVRVPALIVAVIALIAGVFFLRHPYSLGAGAVLLDILLGTYWIVSGVIDLFVVLAESRAPRRAMTALAALVSLIAGIVVLATPSPSMVVIAWVLGAFLLVLGVISIVQALLAWERPARTPQGAAAP